MSNVVAFDPTRRGRRRTTLQTAAQGTPLAVLAQSWALATEEAGLSKHTRRNYSDTLKLLIPWLEEHGHPTDSEAVTAEHVRAFLVDEKERTSAASAATRYRILSTFWAWVIAEGERENPSPMTNVSPPKVPEKAKEFFTDDELRALLAVCEGKGFAEIRDSAIIRIFIDNGVRVSGLANLKTGDVDLQRKRIRVWLKGGKELWVPIGRKAVRALDRYMRARAKHPCADSEWLWLGQQGSGMDHLTDSGVRYMLRKRGRQAGVPHVHPHRFRADFADAYLEGGGDVDGLMAIAGWTSYDMPRRYAGERAAERARQAHERLSPGDRI